MQSDERIIAECINSGGELKNKNVYKLFRA